ncbi:MAG: polysaccharide deacetylase family protein [Candidatus Woesearchaeota archaeon]|nr:polysaccharide deacetylase family protein [Candidatus Woesearchaeota archaeon]
MKRKDIPVLMYHEIAPVIKNKWTISPSMFREQINYLVKNKFQAITPDDIYEFLVNNKNLPEKPIMLTFDDGREGTKKYAAPLLEENNFNAVFYITSDWADGKNIPESEAYSAFMSWNDIQELSEKGFVIGCHGKTHNDLTKSDENSLNDEIKNSKNIIEEKINKKVEDFSYPYGLFNENVVKKVEESGYKTAVTIRSTLNNKFLPPLELSRRWVTNDVFLGKFIKLLATPTLSACMIVKNEENVIKRCLDSIKDIADEIIVVDTGSEDKTIEIAESFGAKIIKHEWKNDFSEARNAYLQSAASDWILTIDADEVIDRKDLLNIKRIMEFEDFDAFRLMLFNYSNNENDVGWVKLSEKREGYSGYLPIELARLFRNNKKYRYEGAVHEAIENSIMKNKGRISSIDIPIHHFGGFDETLKEKQLKYLEYSKKRLEKNPKDVKACCDIALINFKFLNNTEEAIKSLSRAVEADKKYIRSYIILGEIYVHLKKYEDAISCYEKIIKIDNKNSDAYFNLGQVYFELKKYKESGEFYKKALEFGCIHSEEIYRRLKAISA